MGENVFYLIPGRSVVSLHSSDDPAETSWRGRSELLAPSTQLLSSGKQTNKRSRPALNGASLGYEISLKPLRFTVTKWWFSNSSGLKSNLWQSDDDHTVILISSILRPLPTALIRTFTCCSATETPTPWSRLCLAPRRQRRWRASSIPRTSPSSRIAACLTAHVRRSVWGWGGSPPVFLTHADWFRLFLLCAGNGGYQTVHREAAPAHQGRVKAGVRGRRLQPSDCFWTSSEAPRDASVHAFTVTTARRCRRRRGRGRRGPAESWT